MQGVLTSSGPGRVSVSCTTGGPICTASEEQEEQALLTVDAGAEASKNKSTVTHFARETADNWVFTGDDPVKTSFGQITTGRSAILVP